MSTDSRSSDYSILKRKKKKLFQLEIKPTAIEHWKCLNPTVPHNERIDCSIQSLTFLDIIKDRKEANYYSDLANFKKILLSRDDIVQFIYNNHPSKYEQKIVNKTVFSKVPFDKWYKLLDEKLKPGYATFVSAYRPINFSRLKADGHAFVIGKNKDGTLYVYDPQHDKYLPGYDGLHKYFTEQEFNYIIFIIERPKDGRKRSSASSSSNKIGPTTKKHRKHSKHSSSKNKSKERKARKKRQETRKKRREREKKPRTKKRKTKSSSHRMDISPTPSSKKSVKQKKVSSPLDYIYPQPPADYYYTPMRSSELQKLNDQIKKLKLSIRSSDL